MTARARRIRTAGSGDLRAIAALDASEYGVDAYSRFFYRQAYDLWPSFLVVAGGEESVAGYALGALSQAHAEGWLLAMVVSPDARGLGLGRELVATLVERLRERGCTRVLLTVHPSNEPAIRIYRTIGFEVIGEESEYFGPGEPRQLFALTLPD